MTFYPSETACCYGAVFRALLGRLTVKFGASHRYSTARSRKENPQAEYFHSSWLNRAANFRAASNRWVRTVFTNECSCPPLLAQMRLRQKFLRLV